MPIRRGRYFILNTDGNTLCLIQLHPETGTIQNVLQYFRAKKIKSTKKNVASIQQPMTRLEFW